MDHSQESTFKKLLIKRLVALGTYRPTMTKCMVHISGRLKLLIVKTCLPLDTATKFLSSVAHSIALFNWDLALWDSI